MSPEGVERAKLNQIHTKDVSESFNVTSPKGIERAYTAQTPTLKDRAIVKEQSIIGRASHRTYVNRIEVASPRT